MPHKSNGVQSIVRALSLLDILAESPADCSLGELAARAKLPPSTAHRLLTSLVQAGYAQHDPQTTRYSLGNTLIRLSHQAAHKHDLIQTARPFLETIAQKTGETANLTGRDSNYVIQLDHVDSPNILRVSYPTGERFPLHACASGKLFLTFMPAGERERILRSRRRAFTPGTLTEKADLIQEFSAIARRGYAIDDAEREIGVRCVAVPIYNRRLQVVAALSLTGPSVRLTPDRMNELAALLIKTADAISRSLYD